VHKNPRASPLRAYPSPPRAYPRPPPAILRITTNASRRQARNYSDRKNLAVIGKTSAPVAINFAARSEIVVPKLANHTPVISKLKL